MCLNPFYPITKKGHSSKLKQLAESGISSFVFEIGSPSPVWPQSLYGAKNKQTNKQTNKALNPSAFPSQVEELRHAAAHPVYVGSAIQPKSFRHIRHTHDHLSYIPRFPLKVYHKLSSPRHPLVIAVTWAGKVNITHKNGLLRDIFFNLFVTLLMVLVDLNIPMSRTLA